MTRECVPPHSRSGAAPGLPETEAWGCDEAGKLVYLQTSHRPYSFSFLLFFFLALPLDLWDLSSLARDWTRALAVNPPSSNPWTGWEFPQDLSCQTVSLLGFPFCCFVVVAIVKCQSWACPPPFPSLLTASPPSPAPPQCPPLWPRGACPWCIRKAWDVRWVRITEAHLGPTDPGCLAFYYITNIPRHRIIALTPICPLPRLTLSVAHSHQPLIIWKQITDTFFFFFQYFSMYF